MEIEFQTPLRRDMMRLSEGGLRIVRDGSLDGIPNGAEWVSQILQGSSGALAVDNACHAIKRAGGSCESPLTSVHIHLDGMKGSGNTVKSRRREPTAKRSVAFSNALLKTIPKSAVDRLIHHPGGYPSLIGCVTTRVDEVTYFSRGRLTRHPTMNYQYFHFIENDRFKWLRNVFFFYTQYSFVMQHMVSRSRRERNMYCQALSDSFSLSDIEKAKTVEELADVWYKDTARSGNYNDSRYHEVNLDSFFGRHGTIEMRSHGGTIDPQKILIWVRLHQYILDKLEDMELDDIKLGSKDNASLVLGFIDFIKEDELLVEYVKRLLGYFSGIKIRNNKVTGV